MSDPNRSPLSVGPTGSRWRGAAHALLLVTFCLGMVLSIHSIWMRNQINDTDRYVRTVAPLASDPDLQDAVASAVSGRLDAWLNEDVLTRETFTGRERYLAAPLASALVNYVDSTVRAYVASDQFQQVWEEINRAAHPVVSAVLTGAEGELLGLADGQITLDLAPVVTAVLQRLSEAGVDVFDRLQVDEFDTTFVLFESEELAQIQEQVRAVETAAIALPIVALVALGGYLLLATDRRRATIVAGLGLAVTMSIALLLLALGRWRFLDQLGPEANSGAVAAFFDIIGRYPRGAARILIVVGLAVAAVAYVTRSGSRVRQGRARAGSWLATNWREAKARWTWVDRAGTWAESHRTLMLIALLALCCLVIASQDLVTLGSTWLVVSIAVVGVGAIWLVSRGAPQPEPAGAAAAITTAGWAAAAPATVGRASSVASIAPPAPPAAVEVGLPATAGTARASVLTISLELPEEDVKLLRRLAVVLHDPS
jgi:hypothetical protein